MSVDFRQLPLEEALLVDAVERMCGQYGHHAIAAKAKAVLKLYGLDLDSPGYEESKRRGDLQEVSDALKHDVGYWTGMPAWKSDVSFLNFRSRQLLIILAGLSYATMIENYEGKDILHHIFMSAGEAACFQLIAYALLDDAPWGGYCNDQGKAVVAMMLSPNFYPFSSSAFEDVK